MTSKNILEAYLDRDIVDAVGESTIRKIINTETKNRVSDTEVQILITLLQRQHDNTSMERVRNNIALLELRNVVDAESSVENFHSDKDIEIINFITKLEKLNELIENHLNDLEELKLRTTNNLDDEILKLSTSNWLSNIEMDKDKLISITKEIQNSNEDYMTQI
jgi:hypothetical protein